MQNFINRLPGIGNERIVRCPRCLNEIPIERNRVHNVCTKMMPNEHGELKIRCDYEIPLLYVERYGEAKSVPVQVFGWTSHGKTVYLNALRLMLMNMLRVWPDYNYVAITDRDIKLTQDLRTLLENGIMPKPTDLLGLRDNYIYIMQLLNMVRWESRFLTIMDHAGERFDSMEDFEAHEIPFLTHRDTTTMMFVSVPLLRGELVGKAAVDFRTAQRQANRQGLELPDKPEVRDLGRSMNDLLTIYIETMIKYDKQEQQRNKQGFLGRVGNIIKDSIIQSRRKMVVVLTMGDIFASDLPPNLRNYLSADDMWDRVFASGSDKNRDSLDMEYMEKYMDRLQKVSDSLRDWLHDDVDRIGSMGIGGKEFVRAIESNNIEARYTIVSSLGHNEVSMPSKIAKGFGTKIAPKRVLDPFFWVLEYQKYKPKV